jgi:hypothetical protein
VPEQPERPNERQQDKSIPQVVTELKELTVNYAKQETIDPLRGLGRFVAYGVGGSLVLAMGLGMLGLAGLRALQTETGSTFTGNWSWFPYLIATIVLGAIAALAILQISKDGRQARKRREEAT